MTRLLNSVLVCGLLSSAIAIASEDLTFLSSLQMMPSVENSRGDGDKCTNFAGSWKGTCKTADGKTVEEAFQLKQKGCMMIEVTSAKQKTAIAIGGTFSAGGAIPGSPAVSFGGNFNSNWDKEMKVLSVFMGGGGKKLSLNEMGHGFFAKEEVRMMGEKKMGVQIHVMGGEMKKVSCEFDKMD